MSPCREGTKKTVFVNLMEICNAMHRSPEHVIQYLMAELGTSGTLDGQSRLILKAGSHTCPHLCST